MYICVFSQKSSTENIKSFFETNIYAIVVRTVLYYELVPVFMIMTSVEFL